jgi:hypothetical protein
VANAADAVFARQMTNTRLALPTGVGAVGLFVVMLTHGGVTGGQEWATFPLGTGVFFSPFGGRSHLPTLRSVGKSPTTCRRRPDLGIDGAVHPTAGEIVDLRWALRLRRLPDHHRVGHGRPPDGRAAQLCLFAGRLSYPLYLVHYLLVRAGGSFLRAHPLYGAQLVLFFAAVIGLSVLCLRFIDERVRRALNRRVRRAKSPLPIHAT